MRWGLGLGRSIILSLEWKPSSKRKADNRDLQNCRAADSILVNPAKFQSSAATIVRNLNHQLRNCKISCGIQRIPTTELIPILDIRLLLFGMDSQMGCTCPGPLNSPLSYHPLQAFNHIFPFVKAPFDKDFVCYPQLHQRLGWQ